MAEKEWETVMPAFLALPWGASLLAGTAGWFGYNLGAPDEPVEEETCWKCIAAVTAVIALAAFYVYARWYKRRR